MKQCSIKGCPSSAKNGVRLHRYQVVIFVPDVNDFNLDQIYEINYIQNRKKNGPGSEFGFHRENKHIIFNILFLYYHFLINVYNMK